MLLTTLKSKAACLFVFVLLAAGTGLVAQTGLATKIQKPAAAVAAIADSEEELLVDKGRVDRHGDPLPPGALARLGTVRFRHENWIGQFAVSPDGRTLAAVAGKSLVLWNANTGQPVRRFPFSDEVRCLAFAPDGQSIAVGGADNIVRLLDLASGKEVRQFLGHKVNEDPRKWFSNGIRGASFTPDGGQIITWGSDKTVRVWETASDKELRQLGDKDWTIRGLSSDGKLLAVSKKGSEKVLRLWDVAADKEVRQLTHPADVGSVAFSPDGKTLAVTFGANYPQGPGRITVWDLAGGKAVVTLAGHESAVFALAFAPDGKTLASGGYDKTIRLWDLSSEKERHQPQGVHTPVYQLAFDRESQTLLSRGAENLVRLWDVAAWRERLQVDAPERATESLAYSPDGKLVASTSGSQIWLWELATGRVLRKREGPSGTRFVAFSADGKSLIAGSENGTLQVWDSGTGEERRSVQGNVQQGQLVALSPDGTMFAVGSFMDQMIFLRDLGTGKELRRLEVPAEQPGVKAMLHSLRFSSDGKTLYAASGNHLGLLRWDVGPGTVLPSIGKHDGGLNGIALSPDDRSLAVVTAGGSLYLWELATGQTRLIAKDLGYATSVAFSPDGRWLALTNAGNVIHSRFVNGKEEPVWAGLENREEVRLVRVADGKVARRFAGHMGGIGSVAFSPDGRTLASGGYDTTILIWEVPGQDESVAKDVPALKSEELEALWADLGGDAAKAHGRMATLIATPAQAVRLLGQRLKPVPVVDPQRMAPLLKKLDSDLFSEREAATRELKEMGDAAGPALRKALKEELPLESRRRLEALLDALSGPGRSGERLRTLRAIEVLERIANQDARDLLKRLAGGAAGAWLTEEAQGTLQRLEQQEKARP